jgi:predicted aconitase with swiveling domain
MVLNMKTYKCHKISEGKATGEVMFSKDDFCFYLVDPKTGIVIEKQHCLYGKSIAGKILVFPNGKGSSVVQADGIYQLQSAGTEPKAMIIKNPDTTLVASAIIMETPLVDKVDDTFYTEVKDGDKVTVDATNGVITIE